MSNFDTLMAWTEERERLHKALEAAFVALGKAGGNEINSPYRKAWEQARAALAQVTEMPAR